MPVFRIGPRLVYFAHIPKCAGTAIEHYLADRFGPLAFLDRSHLRARTRWTRSSPQHVIWRDLRRLFPPGFFDSSFTVVRHPTFRLRSVYHWQRDWQQTIPPDTTFEAFLDLVARARRGSSYRYDNHLRPMAQFVPARFRVYRLEEGLAPLVAWLDKLAGDTDGPREIAHDNVTRTVLAEAGRAHRPSPVTAAAHARVADLYAEDFARFGYDPARICTEETTP